MMMWRRVTKGYTLYSFVGILSKSFFANFTIISGVGRRHNRCEQYGNLGEILGGTGASELGSATEAICCSSNSFEVVASVTGEDSAPSSSQHFSPRIEIIRATAV